MDTSRRQKFVRHLRAALGQIKPTVEVMGNRGNTDTEESNVRNAEIWLATSYFADFNEEDFADIPVEIRNQLAESVQRFVAIAREIPGKGPATKKQSDDAKRELLQIVGILDSFDLIGAK